MCGIAGWLGWERDLTREHAVVSAMTGTTRCRGPDDEGIWVDSKVTLGHRRLAVIDIAGGAQPMIAAARADRAQHIVLIYSGEVYNFRELRAELRARGHNFRTRSDTEVVLTAYLEWGADAVTHFNGMFAFAIWDGSRQTLLLARDRLGIKPLYYALSGSALIFGSEPKAILANPLIEAAIDRQGLAELFGLWPFKTPGEAIYRGMRELLPGHILVARPDKMQLQRYWSLDSPLSPLIDASTLLYLLRTELPATVRAGVTIPLAVLLSMDMWLRLYRVRIC